MRKKNLSSQQELTITQAKIDPKQLVYDRIKIQLRNVLNVEKPDTTDATAEAGSTRYRNPRDPRE